MMLLNLPPRFVGEMRGKMKEAVNLLEKAIVNLRSENLIGRIYGLGGEIYVKMGKYEEALNRIERERRKLEKKEMLFLVVFFP